MRLERANVRKNMQTKKTKNSNKKKGNKKNHNKKKNNKTNKKKEDDEEEEEEGILLAGHDVVPGVLHDHGPRAVSLVKFCHHVHLVVPTRGAAVELRIAQREPAEKTPFLLNFSYVCPEPVWVN